MNLTLENQDSGICNLSLSGKISQATADSELDPLRKLVGEANFNQKILLSLQKTSYIDSSGIGWLLSTHKRIRDAGGQLILHSIPRDVQHVLGLMNLNRILKIAKDKQQASCIAMEEAHDA